MKATTVYLLMTLLLIPFQTVSAESGSDNVVTLTAGQVSSAVDIEAAITTATAQGTRPGIVILDGQGGTFVFTKDDRSINIFVSDLTLRGMNQATIENCDDGIFIDDFPLENLVVEHISFFCTGDGVDWLGGVNNATLQHNLFQTGASGISIGGKSAHWLISDNLIAADEAGISAAGARDIIISENHISSNIGVSLVGSTQVQVRKNAIQAEFQGVFLTQESWKNMIQGNTIFGVSQSGIALQPGVVGNRILANRVLCVANASCLTVDAAPEVAERNTIAGNKP